MAPDPNPILSPVLLPWVVKVLIFLWGWLAGLVTLGTIWLWVDEQALNREMREVLGSPTISPPISPSSPPSATWPDPREQGKPSKRRRGLPPIPRG